MPSRDYPALTTLPLGLAGGIYRSPMPFSHDYDQDGDILIDAGLAGVDVVVPLASREECLRKSGRDLHALYDERGLTVIPFTIVDFGTPSKDELTVFDGTIARVHALATEGHHILIHCSAGIGRTGTFVACLAVRVRQLEAHDAIAWVRAHIEGAVEMDSQEAFVLEYASRMRS